MEYDQPLDAVGGVVVSWYTRLSSIRVNYRITFRLMILQDIRSRIVMVSRCPICSMY